jgi:hypothetical protein
MPYGYHAAHHRREVQNHLEQRKETMISAVTGEPMVQMIPTGVQAWALSPPEGSPRL